MNFSRSDYKGDFEGADTFTAGAVFQVHDRLAHERWQQDRLGVKPRHIWQEAVERWHLDSKHKATHSDDIAKLRWLHAYLGDKQLDEIDRGAQSDTQAGPRLLSSAKNWVAPATDLST